MITSTVRRHLELVIRNVTSRPVSELVSVAAGTVVDRLWALHAVAAKPLVLSRFRGRAIVPAQPRLVVFVSQTPRAREAKLAFALRAIGWRVVLLYGAEPAFNVRRYFDTATRYRHVWHALALACRYPSRVFHVFDTIPDQLAETFVKYKPGLVVLDPYDVWEGYKRTPPNRLQRQRFCIENADALCCRDLKPKHLQRRHGYRLPPKLLFFPDYCWGDRADTPPPRARHATGDIHAVNAGTVGIEKRGFGDSGFLAIARVLAGQKIHFHMYPHSTAVRRKQHEADYVALARTTPYLHLHPSMPMDALIDELARFDAGVFLANFLTFGGDSKLFDRETLVYQGSARIADYLDAGITVICNKEMRFAYFMAGRYGTVIDGSIDVLGNLRAHLNTGMSALAQKRRARARSAFSVQRHGGRLGAFYESLCSSEPLRAHRGNRLQHPAQDVVSSV